MRGDTPASTGNVANIITVVRILLAPVFVWMLLVDDGADGLLRYLAAGLFILAIVTDSVDGLLARRQNLITDFGKILDPIADKVLIGGALVALSILGELPWWVTIVILVREIGITVYRFIALRDRVIPASWLGKVKTVCPGDRDRVRADARVPVAPDAVVAGLHGHLQHVLMSVAVVLTVVIRHRVPLAGVADRPPEVVSDELARRIILKLRESGSTVAVAESLTGGLVVSRLIDIPRASEAVAGGVVTYATELKARLLGVDAGAARRVRPGARMSRAQMAEGVRELLAIAEAADYGLVDDGRRGPGAAGRPRSPARSSSRSPAAARRPCITSTSPAIAMRSGPRSSNSCSGTSMHDSRPLRLRRNRGRFDLVTDGDFTPRMQPRRVRVWVTDRVG